MTTKEWLDALFAPAVRKLRKEIDRRAELFKGTRPVSTVNRSVGQLHRDREAEIRDATEGRR